MGEVVGIRAHVCDQLGCNRTPAFLLAVVLDREIAITLSCGEHELDRRGVMYRRAHAQNYGLAPVRVFARRVRADEVLRNPEIRAWLGGEMVAEFHTIRHWDSWTCLGEV